MVIGAQHNHIAFDVTFFGIDSMSIAVCLVPSAHITGSIRDTKFHVISVFACTVVMYLTLTAEYSLSIHQAFTALQVGTTFNVANAAFFHTRQNVLLVMYSF